MRTRAASQASVNGVRRTLEVLRTLNTANGSTVVELHQITAISRPALYRMLEPWSEQIAFPAFGVWGPVRLHLGSLALLRGDITAAERHLMEAGRTSIRAGAPLWEQRATERLEQVAQIAQ